MKLELLTSVFFLWWDLNDLYCLNLLERNVIKRFYFYVLTE